MKIIKFLTIIIMAISLFTSCEKDRTEFVYEGEGFIHFGERNYLTNENNPDIVNVMIYLAFPSATPITVDFEISNSEDPNAVAVEGDDYNFLTDGTSVTFEAGETQKILEFTPVNNLTAGDTTFKEIVINLTSNTAGLILGFPGPDGLNRSTKLTVLDDDCPLLMSNWVGTFKGRELSDYWDQTDNYKFEAGAIEEPNKISLIVTGIFQPQLLTDPNNAWGEVWVTGGTVTLILDLTDPANPKSIIEPQYFGETVDPSDDHYEYWIFQNSGPGTFSTCNKTLSIPYSISWDDAYTPSSWANFTVTFDLMN